MNWIERILGYRPAGWRWRLYRIETPVDRRGALPDWVPVPRQEARRWQGPEKIPFAQVVGYAQAFTRQRPRHRVTSGLLAFLAKAPHIEAVESQLKRQEWEAAEAELRAILALDDQDARARFLLGLCQTQRGELEAAEASLSAASTGMSESADYHAARGALHEASGEPEPALDAYRRALEIDSGHTGALERLAAHGELVEIFLGELEAPEKAYLSREAYAEVIRTEWDRTAPDAATYVARSHHHLRRGQLELAREAAERACAGLAAEAGAPTGTGTVGEATAQSAARLTIEARAALCRALLAQERFAEARTAAEALERAAPDSAWTSSCWGHLLWFTGEARQAAQRLRQAIARDPNRMEDLLLYLRPELPRPEGEPLAALEQLLSEHPEAWSLYALRASILMAAGEWEAGARDAAEAARRGADDETLIDLTGRLGREGCHEAVVALAEAAGGWERFVEREAVLRANLAASHRLSGEEEAGRALWMTVYEDAGAHPDLRLRARRILDEREAPVG